MEYFVDYNDLQAAFKEIQSKFLMMNGKKRKDLENN